MIELLPIASLDKHLNKQSDLAEEHLRVVKRKNEKQEQRYQNDQQRQCY
jgi:hypothetical protein